MRIHQIIVFKLLGYLLYSLSVPLLYSGMAQAMDLPKVINKTNCSQYKDLLIPALYRAVEKGDFVITLGSVDFKYKLENSFISASVNNAGKFDVNKEGDLVSKKHRSLA